MDAEATAQVGRDCPLLCRRGEAETKGKQVFSRYQGCLTPSSQFPQIQSQCLLPWSFPFMEEAVPCLREKLGIMICFYFIFEVVYLCVCVCYVFMCFCGVCVCECVHVCMRALEVQKSESDVLEMVLQMIVSHPAWALEFRVWAS